MSLKDALAALPEKDGNGGATCRIDQGLSKLDQEDQDAAWSALKNPRYSNRAIAEVLQSAGIEVSESTVRKHRPGGPSCVTCRKAGRLS